MCVSAEVSFGAAAALSASGAWCLRRALRTARWFWPFAVIPILFGVQQAAEGFVWVGLHREIPELVRAAELVYLFFALAFWPTWFSFAVWRAETSPSRRRFLAWWTLLCTAWFWIAFLPVLTEAAPHTAADACHSVRYEYSDGGLPLHRWLLRFLYLATSLVAYFASSARRVVWVPVALAILSSGVAALLYDHAFTSVWCLSAAACSTALMYVSPRVPAEPPGRWPHRVAAVRRGY